MTNAASQEQMRKRILLFILASCLSVSQVIAQQALSAPGNKVSVSDTDKGKFYYANRNDPPRAIAFKEKTVASSHFVANINQYLNVPAELTFVEEESNTDQLGMRHRVMQQYYRGIPLEGLVYRVHEKNGFVTSANGKAIRDIKVETQTTISEEQAFHLALKYLNTKDSVVRKGRRLIVSKNFTFTPESFSIAFQFDIDVSLIEQWRVSIDARTGSLINKVSLVNTCRIEEEPTTWLPYGFGTGLSNYYGQRTIRVEQLGNGSSRLAGQTEHGGVIGTYDFRNVSIVSLTLFYEWHKVYDFYSANNTYNTAYQKPAVSVQWATEQAYEYYFRAHNRNSFDNNGSPIKSYVHVDENLNNAFWTHNLLAFGDGNNNNPLVDLDVVSHELTHGVTQYEANLQYYNESGALNESFSDILGKAVEFDVFGDTATWQMAKHYGVGGIRNLSNPNLKNQPDTYSGDLWYTGYDDGGGVHTNSGVQNFWFYLLCEGGSGVNDHQLSYSVNAIGIDVATKIAYRNLTEYLGPNSDYLDSRIGSMLAATDLYGYNSAVYQEVDKAWDAVGVIDEPIITKLEAYDITATTVKLRGALLPRGNAVTYHFEYGATPALGTSSSVYSYTNNVEAILTGLQSETKYYLRLVATNENGSTFFPLEFTTISLAPLVRIKQTVDVTETTATLHGEINPNSLPTTFYFEYGPTPALGLITPDYSLPGATEFLSVSAPVTDLQPLQTYYYRLVATNGFSSAVTEAVSFFTAVKPVIISFLPATAAIGEEVTITGQNFNPILEKNVVSFGATRGTVLSSSSTEIKVKVPAGASLAPISLLDAASGLTTESIREFVPTFTAEFRKNDMKLTVGINSPNIYQTAVQDMDGDNKPDIVARHYLGFSVYQNVNQGGDVTDESFVRNTFNSEYSPGTFSLVDFDGNGLKDVVAMYQGKLRIYPNYSVPGYVFFGAPVDLPDTGSLQDFVFSDFDMDGHIDIGAAVSVSGTRGVMIIRNGNPAGSVSPDNFAQRYVKQVPHDIRYLTSGDLNNDGAPDLMISIYGIDFLLMLKNNSRPGTLDFEEDMMQDLTRGRFARYVAHDLNGDGWKDVIAHSLVQDGNLSVFENQKVSPDISLAAPAIALSDYTETAIQSCDFNGDGNIDLVVGTDRRELVFLSNRGSVGGQLSGSSFENFATYGMKIDRSGVDAQLTINDLNGDGRPEVINTYNYSYGPHDGYEMEIWQNAPGNCPDPSLIELDVSNYIATIVLPPNATLDQYEIEYTPVNYTSWMRVSSTTLYLSASSRYQMRIRARCYLGFTDYHYIDFTADCVDSRSLYVKSVGAEGAVLQAYDISSLEIEYSQAGENAWKTLPQSATVISNLSPGTTYDLRVRGRCATPTQFIYKQFTTACPKLSTLTIIDISHDQAKVFWRSVYAGDVFFEYSTDNVTWSIIEDAETISSLIPATTYYVRGRIACADIDSDFLYTSFTTTCPKVSELSVTAITPFSASITWVDNSGADRFRVAYSLTAGGPVIITETSSTSFMLTGLSPGAKYTVTVAPRCTGGAVFESIVFSTVCYVPFDLSVTNVTHTTAELTWNDNFSGVPYYVDYAISGSNVWLTTQSASTQALLSKLRPGTEYEVRVHINCLSETPPYVSLRFETDLYDETTYGPNPTSDKITLKPSKDLIGNRYIIADNAGRVVASGELADYTIDFSNYAPGVYTLKIDGEDAIRIVKR